MQYIITLSLLLLFTGNVFGQATEYFIERHGGYTPSRIFETGGAVAINDSTFALAYYATREGTPYETLIVDYLSTDGQATTAFTFEEDYDLLSNSICRTDNGDLWVLAEELRYDNDNFSNLRLIKIAADNTISEYTYDNARYEFGTGTLIQSGPNSVSFLTESRFEHLSGDNLNLITVDLNDGTIISNVDLSGLQNGSRFSSLTKGADGQVLVSLARIANSQLAIVDVNSGTLLADGIMIESAGCSNFFDGLYAINYLYNSANETFIQVNHCMDVYEITSSGEVTVKNNVSLEPTLIPNFPIYLRSTDAVEDGLYAYADNARFLITPTGDNYEIIESSFLSILPQSIGSDFVNGKFVINGQMENLNQVTIYDEPTDSEINIAAYDEFVDINVRNISRSVGLGNNEVLVGEEINFGAEAKILFYATDGTLLDSIYLGEEAQSSPRGFGVLPNGNYVTSLIRRLESPDRIDVVSFNRTDGITDTLFTVEETTLFGNLVYQAIQGPDGNFYFSYLTANDNFELTRRIMGIDENGTATFDVTVPAQYTDSSNERPAIAADGSVYLVNEVENSSVFQLQRYSENSELEYEIEFNHGYNFTPYVTSVYPNDAGTKLLIGATGENGGVRENLFYEFDAFTGDLLRTQSLSEEEGISLVVQTIYQPGTDNILAFYNEFKGDDSGVNERISVTMAVYDEGGVFYEEDLLLAFNTYFLYDVVTTDNFEVYLCGFSSTSSENVQESFLIGIDYDNVVSVEEVPDLAKTAKLKVFPNPASELATISWDQQNEGSFELEVMNAEGRRLIFHKGEINPGRASFNLNLSRWPVGTYFARLTTDDGVSTQRILRQ